MFFKNRNELAVWSKEAMLLVLILAGLLLVLRTLYILSTLHIQNFKKNKNVKLMAIAGSGGHTSELIRLLSCFPSSFQPRYYVTATSDHMSERKIMKLEKSKNALPGKDYHILRIPRSREVAQSWISTLYTTFYACLCSLSLMWKSKPDLILCNGPGTCIPLCVVGFLFKILGICWTDIIYVESICRVTTMSMSGRLLYPFANKLFVQWPHLLKQYPKALYLGGRIV